MKKLVLLTLSLMVAVGTFAQNGNVVLFSEGGERFTAILNGERINPTPATNVKIEDLNQPGYKLKVIFEDVARGEVNKDLMTAPGEEVVYMIKLDKKGGYKVVYRSQTPIAQAAPVGANTYVYHWGAPAPAPAPAPVVVSSPAPAPTSTNTVVVEETVVTTTTTGGTPAPAPGGENVSMNVNVPGFGMNVNINSGSTTTNTTTVGSSSTVVTTTTTTTSTTQPVQPQPVIVEPVATATPCAMMDNSSYSSAQNSIKSKSFEDSKLTLAKQITQNNCLSASQVKGIMELFSFEDTKLQYAKFAWGYCYEQNKYYEVNDAFDFESSIEELDTYINAQR